MLRQLDLYNKAISLRRRGFSYNEILKHLPVAKSTISSWCGEILLTEEQRKRLDEKRKNNFIRFQRKRVFQSKKEAKI